MSFDGLSMVLFTVVMLGISVTRHVNQLLYQIDEQEPGTDQHFSQTFKAAVWSSKLDIFDDLMKSVHAVQ